MNLPCKECGGKCCGVVPIPKLTIDLLRLRGRVPPSREIDMGTGAVLLLPLDIGADIDSQCVFYDKGCSIYDDRPLVCRMYGEHPALPCAFVHPKQSKKMMKKYLRRLSVKE